MWRSHLHQLCVPDREGRTRLLIAQQCRHHSGNRSNRLSYQCFASTATSLRHNRGFAPHEQDYEPSADQFANMNSALNWMLLQPADDGVAGSSIAFAAWPCSWDVDFKLAAPLNTTVEGVFKDGKVQSWRVSPTARTSSVLVQPCQKV